MKIWNSGINSDFFSSETKYFSQINDRKKKNLKVKSKIVGNFSQNHELQANAKLATSSLKVFCTYGRRPLQVTPLPCKYFNCFIKVL